MGEKKASLVQLIMSLFNDRWVAALAAMNAAGPVVYLQDQPRLRELSLILRVNERMVTAAGAACHVQLTNIYFDKLKIYKVCSDFIRTVVLSRARRQWLSRAFVSCGMSNETHYGWWRLSCRWPQLISKLLPSGSPQNSWPSGLYHRSWSQCWPTTAAIRLKLGMRRFSTSWLRW